MSLYLGYMQAGEQKMVVCGVRGYFWQSWFLWTVGNKTAKSGKRSM